MLTVVVPATDEPPTLARCLAALARSDEPHAVEVVTSPAGCGPAAARNAGVARGGGDVVVFVDADVEVHPDALRLLRSRLDAEPGLDAVFGSYDGDPAAPQLVSRFRNLLHHHVHTSSPGPAQTFWAGLGAIRREAFEAAGGFDAARFPRPSIEDVELGMRMRAGGARIALDPAVRGTHLKRWTLRSMVRTDFAARGVPWVALAFERGGAGSSLNLSRRQRAATVAALATIAALALGRPRVAAAALLAMIAANMSFYVLLGRRGGLRLALAGVPLHLLHHATAALSVPAGAAVYARGRLR
jgi:GT2 family glycosyltransferase